MPDELERNRKTNAKSIGVISRVSSINYAEQYLKAFEQLFVDFYEKQKGYDVSLYRPVLASLWVLVDRAKEAEMENKDDLAKGYAMSVSKIVDIMMRIISDRPDIVDKLKFLKENYKYGEWM